MIREGDAYMSSVDGRARPNSALPATNRPQIFDSIVRFFKRPNDGVPEAQNQVNGVSESKILPNRVYNASPVGVEVPDPMGSSRNPQIDSHSPKFPLLSHQYRPEDQLLQKKPTNFYDFPTPKTMRVSSSGMTPPPSSYSQDRKFEKSKSIFKDEYLQPAVIQEQTSRIYLKYINTAEINREFPPVNSSSSPMDSMMSTSRLPYVNAIGSNRSNIVNSGVPAGFSTTNIERSLINANKYRPYSHINGSKVQKDTFAPKIKTERFGGRQIVSSNPQGQIVTGVSDSNLSKGNSKQELAGTYSNVSGVSGRSKSPGGHSIFGNSVRPNNNQSPSKNEQQNTTEGNSFFVQVADKLKSSLRSLTPKKEDNIPNKPVQ